MSATTSGGSPRRRPDVSRLRAVLFDVDGTLLDTLDAWVRAFDAGLAAIRRPSMSGSEAARWIGTPIETIYKERCGLAGDDLAKAVRVFQQVEAESVHDGMRAYPGIPEALAALRAWKLAAVTNKRYDTTVEALRVTALLPFFALILGGDSVPRKKPFPDPILQAAKGLGVTPTECVVVGDTENDVRAAKEAGARSIGVTWGYGTRTNLEAAGVDHLIETPEALPPLLRALAAGRPL
ncbi:MAG: HAD family hydrolase [Methanobacteriota archaeon]|nr:MAG: HAD family hydrolase [Euryarchaeota archaeon]